MPISYEKLEIPVDYFCSRCSVKGIKLWRQYNTFLDALKLTCCACADPTRVVDEDGRSTSTIAGMRTDQLEDVAGKTGSLIPAVPTVEADTYWGYSAVPVAGCAWWRALPNKIAEKARPFYIDPKDLAAEQKMLDDTRRFNARPDQYKLDTVFLVEATSFEKHALWCEYADEASICTGLSEHRRLLMGMLPSFIEDDLFDRERFMAAERRHKQTLPQSRHMPRIKWEQLNPGSGEMVGAIGEHQTWVSCFWARIDGQVVMFYEATSQFVDHKQIEQWLDREYAHVPRWGGGRIPKCDAMNFAHCLHAIQEINQKT